MRLSTGLDAQTAHPIVWVVLARRLVLERRASSGLFCRPLVVRAQRVEFLGTQQWKSVFGHCDVLCFTVKRRRIDELLSLSRFTIALHCIWPVCQLGEQVIAVAAAATATATAAVLAFADRRMGTNHLKLLLPLLLVLLFSAARADQAGKQAGRQAGSQNSGSFYALTLTVFVEFQLCFSLCLSWLLVLSRRRPLLPLACLPAPGWFIHSALFLCFCLSLCGCLFDCLSGSPCLSSPQSSSSSSSPSQQQQQPSYLLVCATTSIEGETD